MGRPATDRISRQEQIFPGGAHANIGISISHKDTKSPLSALMADQVPCDTITGGTSQYLPRWTYRERNRLSADPAGHYDRVSNISAAALGKFRQHYGDDGISDDDLFYYAYGVLHHPGYRERYAADLSKQAARIPLAGSLADFREIALAGRALSDMDLNYETADPYPLDERHADGADANPDAPDFYRVTKMRLGKRGKSDDRSVIIYNANLTLAGIPPVT